VSAPLVAATLLASLAALSLLAWAAALPGAPARLVAASLLALLTWLLLPLALETGLRDLTLWLGEAERARDLAALATLDAMAGGALTVRALWGTASGREQALLRWSPPLTAPLAVFGACVIAAQSADTLAFGTLRVRVAAGVLAATFAGATLLAMATRAPAARLELRLAGALPMLPVAAWLAALASAPPGGTAPPLDLVALAAIAAGGLLVAAAGFVRERRRSRR
jgi:hypothetical protein